MLVYVWCYSNWLAVKTHFKPSTIFLMIHTLLWCDLAWILCHLGCALFTIPAAMHSLDILLIAAYSGVFGGVVGGAIYLIHKGYV